MAASTLRILVVDDIEDNRVLLKRRLEKDTVVVEEAENGTVALEKLDAERFDLVLLDIHMPGMGGVEVLRRIRQQFPQSKLPVMMLTASNQIADVLEAHKSGANDYITKPINFPVALARIKSVLAGSGLATAL